MVDILAWQTLVVDKEGTKVNAEEYLKGKVVALYVAFFKWYFLVICVQIFKALKNQRGTLGNRKFFCCGGLLKGLEGGQEPSKTPSAF